jgi:hypothetical protein
MMAALYTMLDDEEAAAEDYVEFVTSEAFGSFLSGLPFGSSINAASRGYDAGGVMGSAIEAPFDLYRQAIQGENDAGLRRAVGNAIGLVTGLPTAASMRAIEGAMDEEKGLSEALFGRNPVTN